MMTVDLHIGDLVQVIHSPEQHEIDAGFLKYRNMVGVVVDIDTSRNRCVVQFDDDSEVEFPADYLSKE